MMITGGRKVMCTNVLLEVCQVWGKQAVRKHIAHSKISGLLGNRTMSHHPYR